MRILEEKDISQKIVRLAYQILEEYIDEGELYVFGINNNGNRLKNLIVERIRQIEPSFSIHSQEIRLDPANPKKNEITIDTNVRDLKNKNILIIDDVASTGRTLYFAISHFDAIVPKSIKVGVLVDRKHKSFPIKVDFVGRSLATTINDDILVYLDEKTDWHAIVH